jgi:hypothetical protein
MKKVLGDYLFGYDLKEIEDVMDYLKKNYKGDDYEMWIGRGDDIMNGLEVFSEDIMEDEVFLGLIKKCDGEGSFNEDEYNEEVWDWEVDDRC